MPSILICSTPAHGHIVPLGAIAEHLVAEGHRVRFLTSERYRARVESTGATLVPLPAGADIDMDHPNEVFPERAALSGVPGVQFDLMNIFVKPSRFQFESLHEALAAEPTDVILSEQGFGGVGYLATVPRSERPTIVFLGIFPVSLSSKDTAPFGLGIPPMAGPLGRLRNAVLYRVANTVIFGEIRKESDRLCRELTGNSMPVGFMDGLRLGDAVVQFTVPEFEYPRSDLPDTVRFVGPMSRTRSSNLPLPEWWGDLDGSRPVVHVTQGTVANDDLGKLVEPTIEALADDNVLVVVSTGGRDPRDALRGPVPDNVRTASYLPYDRLLPRTGVMVTNGGYGGVHYAMEHGVPLVVAGATEDKIEVTARVAWSGVGINLKTNTPAPGAIRAAVRRVLTDPRYAMASARIGEAIAAAPGLTGLDDMIAYATRAAGAPPGLAAETG